MLRCFYRLALALRWKDAWKALAGHPVLPAGWRRAELEHVRWHDLRHTFASLLIAEGLNVVFVSRQLGHASPDITLKVYAHLFDRAEHGQRASDALESGFGTLLGKSTTAELRA